MSSVPARGSQQDIKMHSAFTPPPIPPVPKSSPAPMANTPILINVPLPEELMPLACCYHRVVKVLNSCGTCVGTPLLNMAKKVGSCVSVPLYWIAQKTGLVWVAKQVNLLYQELKSSLTQIYNETCQIFVISPNFSQPFRIDPSQVSLEQLESRLKAVSDKITSFKVEKLEDCLKLSAIGADINSLNESLRWNNSPETEQLQKLFISAREEFAKIKKTHSETLVSMFYSTQVGLLKSLQQYRTEGVKKIEDLKEYREYLSYAEVLEKLEMLSGLGSNKDHKQILEIGSLLMIPFADQVGLPNKGNTCWMNSAIQALMVYSKEILACQEPVKENVADKGGMFDRSLHSKRVEILKSLQSVVRAFGRDAEAREVALEQLRVDLANNPDVKEDVRSAIGGKEQEDVRFFVQTTMRLFQQHHYQHVAREAEGKESYSHLTRIENPYPVFAVAPPVSKEAINIESLINSALHSTVNDTRNPWRPVTGKSFDTRTDHTIITSNPQPFVTTDNMPPPDVMVFEVERLIQRLETPELQRTQVRSLLEQQREELSKILKTAVTDEQMKKAATVFFQEKGQDKNDTVIRFPKDGIINPTLSGPKKPATAYETRAFIYHRGDGNGGHYNACRRGHDNVWREYWDGTVRSLSQRELEDNFAKVTHIFTRRVTEANAVDSKSRAGGVTSADLKEDASKFGKGLTLDILGSGQVAGIVSPASAASPTATSSTSNVVIEIGPAPKPSTIMPAATSATQTTPAAVTTTRSATKTLVLDELSTANHLATTIATASSVASKLDPAAIIYNSAANNLAGPQPWCCKPTSTTADRE